MEIKMKAYELHLQGLSYKRIADALGISKTSAFEYVKEIKLINGAVPNYPVPSSTELQKERNSARLEKRSEPVPMPLANANKAEAKKTTIKEFTGDELIKKTFDCLEFTGKFLELIGKPSRRFSGIIWGLPKGGKSNFSLRFADYLQEYFGKVGYIAAEEGESVTLQEKFKQIGGSSVTVLESRIKEEVREHLPTTDYDFVFIDSINTAGIDNDFLELLKEENPKKSFIAIVQATKGGNFKGDQALTHNCDFIIKVVAGVAYHTGRFNVASEIKIFEEPLYVKNPVKKISDEKTLSDEAKEPVSQTKPAFPIVKSKNEFVKPAIIPAPTVTKWPTESLNGLAPLKPKLTPEQEMFQAKIAGYALLGALGVGVADWIWKGIKKSGGQNKG